MNMRKHMQNIILSDPYKLIWEMLSPKTSIHSLEMTGFVRENLKDIYGKELKSLL